MSEINNLVDRIDTLAMLTPNKKDGRKCQELLSGNEALPPKDSAESKLNEEDRAVVVDRGPYSKRPFVAFDTQSEIL